MSLKNTLLVVSLIGLTQIASAFDEVGPPKKVTCDAVVLVSKTAIRENMDINDLLADHDEYALGDVNPTCGHDPDRRSGTCEAIIKDGKLSMRYAFNTQSGILTVKDKATGISVDSSWTNQYKVTKSGYLTTSVWLTNTKGGLMGDPRAFRVEASCQAIKGDW